MFYIFFFLQDHDEEDPLRRGLQDVGPLPDAHPQARDRPSLALRDRQADHLHQHRARSGGRGHHRRRVKTKHHLQAMSKNKTRYNHRHFKFYTAYFNIRTRELTI